MINNYINTLSQGILLGWGNYALDLPYAYGNNINNTFSNNQIIGSQISPVTLTSALTVTVAGNSFLDVMCNVFGAPPLVQHQVMPAIMSCADCCCTDSVETVTHKLAVLKM